MADVYNTLDGRAVHVPDLCPAISRSLVDMLVERLPASPALTLSVGCGSGLLEAVLLHAGETRSGKPLNVVGVEVPDCHVKHLPENHLAKVSSTSAVHDDALLASALLFVYPRQAELVARYLDASSGGALEQLFWLGHRSDWPEMEMLLLAAFFKLETVDRPGIAESEVLAVASLPRMIRKEV